MNATAAQHAYWVEEAFCGEVDPFAVGDACVVEVANENENFVIILDFDYTNDRLEELGVDELDKLDIVLEKTALKRAKKEQIEALDSLVKTGLKVFTIDSRFVEITKL